MAKEPLIVYWTPKSTHWEQEPGNNWNLMYPEPVNLMQELSKSKTKESKKMSFFSCPAVSGRLKNTFVFRNNVKTTVHWDITDPLDPIIEVEEYGINCTIPREPALEGTAMIWLFLGFLFFCEEPLIAQTQVPYMHRPGYTNKGVIVPGGYDISSWFRAVNCEMLMWDEKGSMTIEEDEPLMYLELLTDRPVIFKRFVYTEEIAKIDVACVRAPKYFGRNLPLVQRYKRFKETRTHEILAKEIKKNLVGE